jgi:hypothetical protein
MTMNPEQEHQALRRLLALKRHEQPPPGYFNRFSGQVIARIRAGEQAPDSLWERLSLDLSWVQRLWTAFETKPLLAGAFGVTVCGLITTGFLFSDRSSTLQPAPLTVFTSTVNPQSGLQVATPAASPLFGQVPGLESSSTGSVDGVQVRASLFQELKPQSRLVNFSLPGGN